VLATTSCLSEPVQNALSFLSGLSPLDLLIRLDGDQSAVSADLVQVPADVLRSLYKFPLKSLSEFGGQLEASKATCIDLFVTVILRLSSLIGSERAREILERALDEGSIPRDMYLSLSQLVK